MTQNNKNNDKQTPSPDSYRDIGRAGVRLKVCGMKRNTLEVAELLPDYLGFIFWEPSSRHFDGEIPEIHENSKKAGVFVDASPEEITKKVNKYGLDAIQLHGRESAVFCKEISIALDGTTEIIKVFSIKDSFDFSVLSEYENVCDYFLFDTKGKLPGGNGYTFDWSILKNYPSTKPYFLSGGIGLEETDKLNEFLNASESKYCYAIDVNSKFEIEPGLKDIEKLKQFKEELSTKY